MIIFFICIWFKYFTDCGWSQYTWAIMLKWHIVSRNYCYYAVYFFTLHSNNNLKQFIGITQKFLTQWRMIKEMQSVYKSVFTNILCISWKFTEAKPIIKITVYRFALIQWTSQQVSQPECSPGCCRAVESTGEFCPTFCQCASTDRHLERESHSSHFLNYYQIVWTWLCW